MKKTVFLTLIICLLLVSGCTQTQTNGQDTAVNKDDFAMRRPDFGQPERDADTRGLVKSIIGNEITILKIERSQSGQADLENSDENADSAEDSKASVGAGTTGTRIPGMGGGMRSSGAVPDDAARDAILERMKEMSTGEEIIVVPVGIQMLKPNENNEEKELIEATFEDVDQDKMIQVWLNESVTDRKVAEFILITR